MKLYKKYFVLFIIALSSCTEKIDIELGETYSRLVVEGEITTDDTAHFVRLTKTSDYFYNQTPPPVEGATVTINDGMVTRQLTESEPGLYLTERFAGEVGKSYVLSIELAEEINGFKEYSAESAIPPINPIDSIGIEYYDMWDAWEVQIYAQEPPTTDFYMFVLYRNGNLTTDTLSEVFVSDDRLFNGNYTNGIGVGYFQEEYPDEILQSGDTVTLKMASISEEYYNFVWKLQIESGYKNPLFSGPPANIPSNISNGAVGFFTAYSAEYSSTIYEP